MDEATPTPYGVDATALDEPLLAELVRVYLDANEPDDPVRRRDLFSRHALEPGWQAAVAGTPPVGFGYGFHCHRGQWWRDAVHGGLSETLGNQSAGWWLSDAFCLAELHVRRRWQRRGVGSAITSTLLGARAERTVVLSTPHDAAAHGFYTAIGYTELVTGLVFPGVAVPYTVLGRVLQQRSG